MFNHHLPHNVSDEDLDEPIRYMTTMETPQGLRALILKRDPAEEGSFMLLDIPAFEDPHTTRDAIAVGERLPDRQAVSRIALSYVGAILSGGCQHCCPTCSGGPAVLV